MAESQLKTSYMGLELRNPIVVASSDLTKTAEGMKKCEDAGAGAIVTACAGHTGIELDFGHDELHAREHLIPVNEGHPRGVRPGGIRTCGRCIGDPGGAQAPGRTDLLDIKAGALCSRQQQAANSANKNPESVAVLV